MKGEGEKRQMTEREAQHEAQMEKREVKQEHRETPKRS
jgi:hypothetical protein